MIIFIFRSARLESSKEFPPRQKPASFSIDQILQKLMPKD
jgi:hypothetical protein